MVLILADKDDNDFKLTLWNHSSFLFLDFLLKTNEQNNNSKPDLPTVTLNANVLNSQIKRHWISWFQIQTKLNKDFHYVVPMEIPI